MNILVSIAEKRNKIQEFQVFDLGQITTTLQDLLDDASIEVTTDIIPILLVTDTNDIVNQYIIKDLLEDENNRTQYITGQNLLADDLIYLGGITQPTTLYKSYFASLVQSGTDAPVATILGDELEGTIIFTRDDVGEFTATSNGTFTLDKTVIIFCNNTPSLYGDKATYTLNTVKFHVLTTDFIGEGFLNTDGFDPLVIEIRVFN